MLLASLDPATCFDSALKGETEATAEEAGDGGDGFNNSVESYTSNDDTADYGSFAPATGEHSRGTLTRYKDKFTLLKMPMKYLTLLIFAL